MANAEGFKIQVRGYDIRVNGLTAEDSLALYQVIEGLAYVGAEGRSAIVAEAKRKANTIELAGDILLSIEQIERKKEEEMRILEGWMWVRGREAESDGKSQMDEEDEGLMMKITKEVSPTSATT